MNKRQIGTNMEQTAALWLENQGFRILERNYRCRIGEIDIIAEEDGYLVFVEVKYRKDFKKGPSFSAVSFSKQKKISEVAMYYLSEKKKSVETPCRFDVLGIDGEQISLKKNAFYYHGYSF